VVVVPRPIEGCSISRPGTARCRIDPRGLDGGHHVQETILAWEPPTRWAYRVDECSAPIARALVEDWIIQPKGEGSVVRWTFTIDPRALFIAGLPVAGPLMGKLFAKAMRNLSEQLVAAGRT